MSALKGHNNRIYQVETLYTCETCGSKFLTRRSLNAHIRTHAEEKPFKCETCDVQCAQARDMKVHTRIHTGENVKYVALDLGGRAT